MQRVLMIMENSYMHLSKVSINIEMGNFACIRLNWSIVSITGNVDASYGRCAATIFFHE